MKSGIFFLIVLMLVGCKAKPEHKTGQMQFGLDDGMLYYSNAVQLTDGVDVIGLLEKYMYKKWLQENPQIAQTTEPSLFNAANQDSFLIIQVEIFTSKDGGAWAIDCDLSILKFLSQYSHSVRVEDRIKYGANTSIEINWIEEIPAIIYTEDTMFQTKVEAWDLSGYGDCGGVLPFPTLNLEHNKEYPEKDKFLDGIAILPNDNRIHHIKRSELELKTIDNQILKGLAYDIDEDGINDIFTHHQVLGIDEKEYRRLYINVDGRWVYKWAYLYEVCF